MFKKLILIFLIIFTSSSVYGMDNGTLMLEFEDSTIIEGDISQLKIKLKDIPKVYGGKIIIEFDPQYIKAVNPTIDLGQDMARKKIFQGTNKVHNDMGKITLIFTLLGNETPLKDNSMVGTIPFKALKDGHTEIVFKEAKLLRKDTSNIDHHCNTLNIDIEDEAHVSFIPNWAVKHVNNLVKEKYKIVFNLLKIILHPCNRNEISLPLCL